MKRGKSQSGRNTPIRELTIWITPFTNLTSIDDAIWRAKSLAAQVSSPGRTWHANLLLPTHFGKYPQSVCNQTLPHDLTVSGPADVQPIRDRIEAAGLGFGGWGVPNTADTGRYAGQFAAACGFYAANFEPQVFWLPGDDGAAIVRWWTDFWIEASDPLDGNVVATVVPNGWGLGAFKKSMSQLAGGCNALALEVYGGPATPEYPYPSLWPEPATALTREYVPSGTKLLPILATANLSAQIAQANRLGAGNVHLWAI